jgi:multicomponent Na+:H+ antiporter subunit D
MPEWIHPGLLLIAGALPIPAFRGKARRVWMVLLAAGALAGALFGGEGVRGAIPFLDLTLVFGRADRLAIAFGIVFSLMALLGIIYSLHEEDAAGHQAALVYAGSALGAVYAGDLATLFLFWELMAFASVVLIWRRREPASLAAGYRYLLLHVAGGASLLAGIAVHYKATGSLAFGALGDSPGAGLILAGFLLNAAVPPLSAWLTDAYPEATVTGAVFLSAFTTKTAVYALVRGFPGTELLVWLGAAMALYGVVFATLQNDARRLLAYHIVSQVGYMVCGVGLGTTLALNGSVAHAFAHILYKGLLFMGAGAVLHVTGKRLLSEMGGLHRTMPLTFVLYMVGALSISAWPLTSGFISKSIITAAAGEEHRTIVFLMLTAASAGTFLSVGLKLPWFMFFGEGKGIVGREPPRNMRTAMIMAAALCILIGVVPGSVYDLLPYDMTFHPYTVQHVVSSLELLLGVAAVFLLLRRALTPHRMTTLDTDWFYRTGGDLVTRLASGPGRYIEEKVLGPAHESILAGILRFTPAVAAADRTLIDGAVNGVSRGAEALGTGLRRLQDGRLHRYLWVLAAALALMLMAAGRYF